MCMPYDSRHCQSSQNLQEWKLRTKNDGEIVGIGASHNKQQRNWVFESSQTKLFPLAESSKSVTFTS